MRSRFRLAKTKRWPESGSCWITCRAQLSEPVVPLAEIGRRDRDEHADRGWHAQHGQAPACDDPPERLGIEPRRHGDPRPALEHDLDGPRDRWCVSGGGCPDQRHRHEPGRLYGDIPLRAGGQDLCDPLAIGRLIEPVVERAVGDPSSPTELHLREPAGLPLADHIGPSGAHRDCRAPPLLTLPGMDQSR